ncbi:hypothetical protein ACFVTF_24165 [Kitasatospora sp. NPDC057940]|uniref:hypothetical protein n=1 Tax=Kitasatospora sp. NPDC057940 TaxID=3346285 RepID=UPI0036D9976B
MLLTVREPLLLIPLRVPLLGHLLHLLLLLRIPLLRHLLLRVALLHLLLRHLLLRVLLLSAREPLLLIPLRVPLLRHLLHLLLRIPLLLHVSVRLLDRLALLLGILLDRLALLGILLPLAVLLAGDRLLADVPGVTGVPRLRALGAVAPTQIGH